MLERQAVSYSHNAKIFQQLEISLGILANGCSFSVLRSRGQGIVPNIYHYQHNKRLDSKASNFDDILSVLTFTIGWLWLDKHQN